MSEFKLGEHDARLGAIEQRLGAIDRKLDVLVGRDERRKGAWAITVAIASVMGTSAALIVAWIKG